MGNLKLADRRSFETQLLSIYYEGLAVGGVTDLSYKELLTDIKLGMLMRLIVLAVVMVPANLDHIGEDRFRGLGERLEALVDWNCEEVIPK